MTCSHPNPVGPSPDMLENDDFRHRCKICFKKFHICIICEDRLDTDDTVFSGMNKDITYCKRCIREVR